MMRTLVVGGTRGIGRAVARTLAKEGHAVTVIGRREPARRLPKVRYQIADVLNRVRVGRQDNLVFCQRYRGEGDAWQGEFETSLTATRDIIEQCRGAKSIVIIASVAAHWVASEQPVGYHTMKAGLVQMVRYLAVTLGPRGCRVNCVSPCTVLKEESAEFYRKNKRVTRLLQQITPLRRMGTAQDVANVVAWLCSDGAAFVTGQEIIVDGGVSLQWPEALARQLTGLKR